MASTPTFKLRPPISKIPKSTGGRGEIPEALVDVVYEKGLFFADFLIGKRRRYDIRLSPQKKAHLFTFDQVRLLPGILPASSSGAHPGKKAGQLGLPPTNPHTNTSLCQMLQSLKPVTHSALIIPLSQLYLDTRFIFLYLSAYIFYQMHYMILIVGLLFIVAYFQFTRNKY